MVHGPYIIIYGPTINKSVRFPKGACWLSTYITMTLFLWRSIFFASVAYDACSFSKLNINNGNLFFSDARSIRWMKADTEDIRTHFAPFLRKTKGPLPCKYKIMGMIFTTRYCSVRMIWISKNLEIIHFVFICYL